MRITRELLALLHACYDQRRDFDDVYPDGVELTADALRSAYVDHDLEVFWFFERVRCFLTVEQRNARETEISALVQSRGEVLRHVPEYWEVLVRYAQVALCTLLGMTPALDERYWCGCVRTASWQRCVDHRHLDHDTEPPAQKMTSRVGPETVTLVDDPTDRYTIEDGGFGLSREGQQ